MSVTCLIVNQPVEDKIRQQSHVETNREGDRHPAASLYILVMSLIQSVDLLIVSGAVQADRLGTDARKQTLSLLFQTNVYASLECLHNLELPIAVTPNASVGFEMMELKSIYLPQYSHFKGKPHVTTQ